MFWKPFRISAFLTSFVAIYSTTVEHKTWQEIVDLSDHALIGTVFKVDMIDGAGKEIIDPNAMTGPGLENTIRIHIRVDRKNVLYSRATQIPETIAIPLWSMWHYSLGQIQKDTMNNESIFLLKGDNFEPAYEAGFELPLNLKAKILKRKEKKKLK